MKLQLKLNRNKIKDLLFYLKYNRLERLWMSLNKDVSVNHVNFRIGVRIITKKTNKIINYTIGYYNGVHDGLIDLVNLSDEKVLKLSEKDLNIYKGISVRKANIMVIKSRPWLLTTKNKFKPCYRFLDSELTKKLADYVEYVIDTSELYKRSCCVISCKEKPTKYAVRIDDYENKGIDKNPIWRFNYKDYPVDIIDNIYNIKSYRNVYPLTLFNAVFKGIKYSDIIPYAVIKDAINNEIGFIYLTNPVNNWVNLYLELDLDSIRLIEPTVSHTIDNESKTIGSYKQSELVESLKLDYSCYQAESEL